MYTEGLFPYILLFLLVLCNCYINTRRSNWFVVLAIFAFSAMRYNVGYDYMGYCKTMVNGEEFEVNRLELFERWLLLLSRDNRFYQLFFIVNSYITVYFVKWAVDRLSADKSLSYLVFLCFPLLLLQSYSIVRHWTAASIIFYGSACLLNKEYRRFFFCTAVSIGFHSVGYIALVFLPLMLFKFSLKSNIVLLVGALLISELMKNFLLSHLTGVDTFIAQKLFRYVDSTHVEGGMSKIPYIYAFVDIMALLCWYFRYREEELYKQYATIFNFGVSLMLLFSFQTTLAIRFSTPFVIYLLPLVPFFFNGRLRNINILALVTFCAAFYFFNLTIYNETLHRSQFLPYRLFFSW